MQRMPSYGHLRACKNEIMTAEYFLSLKDKKREAILTTKGIFLAQKEIGDMIYDLYQVDSFYVEFSYSISGNRTVTTNVYTDLRSSAQYRTSQIVN